MLSSRRSLFLWYSATLIISTVESGLLRGKKRIGGGAPDRDSVMHGIDVRCIDDPDRIECTNYLLYALTRLEESLSTPDMFHRNNNKKKTIMVVDEDDTPPSPSPVKWEDDSISDYELASSAPTTDMCYGNMARLPYKKYCHSEMPSVSLEPSPQPTFAPEYNPDDDMDPSPAPSFPDIPSTSVPTIIHTQNPSSASEDEGRPPSVGTLGMCQGDCNSPTDCIEGFYCYQRIHSEAVPGCPGSELDNSRTDYCTNVTTITTTTSDDSTPVTDDDERVFRLKLYWNSSYRWQESNIEIEWCIACPGRRLDSSSMLSNHCQAGDELLLEYCSESASIIFFTFIPDEASQTIQIQLVDSDLCIERHGMAIFVGPCRTKNENQEIQQWNEPTQSSSSSSDPFELVPITDTHLCMTIHHHPKHGEEIEMIPCTTSRRGTSSLWNFF